jgi:hypothetical protein
MMVEKGKLTTVLVRRSVEVATTVARIEDARLGDVPSTVLMIAHAFAVAEGEPVYPNLEYDPAVQTLHAVAAAVLAYVPAWQDTQGAPAESE